MKNDPATHPSIVWYECDHHPVPFPIIPAIEPVCKTRRGLWTREHLWNQGDVVFVGRLGLYGGMVLE